MIKRTQSRWFVVGLIILVLVVTACSTSSLGSEDTIPVATADTEQIVHAILTKVESQLAQPPSPSGVSIDADEITEAVVAEAQSQLREQVAAASNALDADVITAAVLAEVQSQIEQNAQSAPTVDTDQIVQAVVAQVEPRLTQEIDIENALIRLYQQVNPAVVYIVIPSIGSGSGFVYSADGYIVTNYHVVEAGRDYEVVFASGDRRDAELIGSDVDSDLAVIKVDQLPEGVDPLPLAEAANIQVGQFVVAIGNPFGEQGSMSLGIVSGLGRSLPSQRDTGPGNTYSLPQVVQTDAPINPGNSGGPLLNLAGEVVGVNSAIASTTGTNSGVGFSIPVAAVRQVVPNLVDKGEFVYPYMGVSFDSEITLSEQSELDLSQTQGAYVVSVMQGGPADAAGLMAADRATGRGGDLIVQMDGQEIKDFSDLNSYLVFNTKPGQTIEVTVARNGELIVLPLTLGARP